MEQALGLESRASRKMRHFENGGPICTLAMLTGESGCGCESPRGAEASSGDQRAQLPLGLHDLCKDENKEWAAPRRPFISGRAPKIDSRYPLQSVFNANSRSDWVHLAARYS